MKRISVTEAQRLALIEAIRIGMEDGSLEAWLEPDEAETLIAKLRNKPRSKGDK